MVVTRFAPSPTGYLHVGGARTALFSWLLARHAGGRFLLRIEDTDLARSTQQAVDQLIDDLKWLGLHWDNAELVYQSKRLPVYNAIIDDLIRRGVAYKAYETAEELDNQRKQAERSKRQYRYRRPQHTDEQIRKFESEGRPHVVRFLMPVKDYRFDDAVLGANQGVGAGEVQDFIIRKSDGMPTYHFGVVVDDAEAGVTHILRGQEHLLNTVNHIALQEALGYSRPVYAHLPVILNTDGSKMSKRDRDKKVRQIAGNWMRNNKRSAADLKAVTSVDRAEWWLEDDGRQLDLNEQERVLIALGYSVSELPEILIHDFRANGYLPATLLNFLALLGWSPGGDRERMSVNDMVQLFSLEGVGRANAKFNREKLVAFSTEAFAAAPPEVLIAAMQDYLSVNPGSPLNSATGAQLAGVLKMNAGFRILREVDEKSGFLFVPEEKFSIRADAAEKVLLKNERQGLEALKAVRMVLGHLAEWSAPAIESAIKAHCEATGVALGKIAQPIRVAVSGSTISPPIFQTLEFLGRARSLKRIDACVERFGHGD
ncbi:MAG TPA: glutamate--tRNA ligase [Tepidisphaeraceae bacterium]|nr:glutamate--tRNA ligase [Tepidisphaeraceae bacterium]